jgi:hypothetical protein
MTVALVPEMWAVATQQVAYLSASLECGNHRYQALDRSSLILMKKSMLLLTRLDLQNYFPFVPQLLFLSQEGRLRLRRLK